MGTVRAVVLTLGGAQQGERPLGGQRGPGQRDLEQDAHLGHRHRRAFFPRGAGAPGRGRDAPRNSG